MTQSRKVSLTTPRVSRFCAFCCLGVAAGLSRRPERVMRRREKMFSRAMLCSCHNVDTRREEDGPIDEGLFKRKKLKNGKPVNDANVLAQINNGGNGMPAYADMLYADDKANVIAYLHTL